MRKKVAAVLVAALLLGLTAGAAFAGSYWLIDPDSARTPPVHSDR